MIKGTILTEDNLVWTITVNRRRKGDADELEDDEDDETRSLKRAKSQEEAEDNTREKVSHAAFNLALAPTL